MADAVQYIEISEMIKTLSHPQEALNLLENQNHLLPQTAWTLTTKVPIPYIHTADRLHYHDLPFYCLH